MGLSSCGVLDHLLVDLIGTIRSSFDRALLQRQAVEERFQVDVFLGDVSWETSYSLPGEEQPPRVRADLSVDWPTWSQTSYRSWSIGEPPDELPEVVIEVALRVQRMAEAPGTEKVMTALPPTYYLHVWFARRPLVASRAAILGSLLEAGTDRARPPRRSRNALAPGWSRT